jgi:hypothetical protein
MCEKCDEIDKMVERYKRPKDQTSAIDAADQLEAGLQVNKAAIPPG